MSMFDEIKNLAGEAEKLASEHPDQVKAAIAKAEEAIDAQTGHQYDAQIHQGAAQAEGFLDSQKPQA